MSRATPKATRHYAIIGQLLTPYCLGGRQGDNQQTDIGPLINLGTQHDGRSALTWMKRVLTTFVIVMEGRKGFAREHQNGFYET